MAPPVSPPHAKVVHPPPSAAAGLNTLSLVYLCLGGPCKIWGRGLVPARHWCPRAVPSYGEGQRGACGGFWSPKWRCGSPSCPPAVYVPPQVWDCRYRTASPRAACCHVAILNSLEALCF